MAAKTPLKTPQSAKLQAEFAEGNSQTMLESLKAAPKKDTGPIKVREIACLNEMVAILQFNTESSVILAESFKNEGMVVGVGPGLPGPDGVRCKSQLQIGDVVMFADRQIAATLNPAEGPYGGKQIVMINERALICMMPPVPYEVTELPPVDKPWMQTIKRTTEGPKTSAHML